MKWVVLPFSESYSVETKCTEVKFYPVSDFPVIKNTIKRIAFENENKSTIIFQSFLFANVPAESTSYAPTFLVNILARTHDTHTCMHARARTHIHTHRGD